MEPGHAGADGAEKPEKTQMAYFGQKNREKTAPESGEARDPRTSVPDVHADAAITTEVQGAKSFIYLVQDLRKIIARTQKATPLPPRPTAVVASATQRMQT